MSYQSTDSKIGKLLVFGGIYSNLQALEALKQKAEEFKIKRDNIICTGDLVGYCAQPEEVIQFVKKWGIHAIAGNVELQLAEGKEDCGCEFSEGSRCDLFSRQWYPFAQSNISENSLRWIKELKEKLIFNWHNYQVGVVHGSAFETAEYIFKSTPWEKKQRNFEELNTDIILAGHCGLPFKDSKDNKYWINAGVIGMPANDAREQVWFATVELVNNHLLVEHHQLSYDNHKAHKLMIEKQLPLAYAQTLLSGVWDNCEILPQQESSQQGKAIEL